MPLGGVDATYQLLGKPETTIDKKNTWVSKDDVFLLVCFPCKNPLVFT